MERILTFSIELTEIKPQNQSRSGELRIAYVSTLKIEWGLLTLVEILIDHPAWSLDLA